MHLYRTHTCADLRHQLVHCLVEMDDGGFEVAVDEMFVRAARETFLDFDSDVPVLNVAGVRDVVDVLFDHRKFLGIALDRIV